MDGQRRGQTDTEVAGGVAGWAEGGVDGLMFEKVFGW